MQNQRSGFSNLGKHLEPEWGVGPELETVLGSFTFKNSISESKNPAQKLYKDFF